MASKEVEETKEALKLAEEIEKIHNELHSAMGSLLEIEDWQDDDPQGKITCSFNEQSFDVYDAGTPKTRIEFYIPLINKRIQMFNQVNIVKYIKENEKHLNTIKEILNKFEKYQKEMSEK